MPVVIQSWRFSVMLLWLTVWKFPRPSASMTVRELLTEIPMSTVPPAPPVAHEKKKDRGVILVSYPKVVFLYPSVLIAILAALYMQLWGNAALEKADAAHVAAVQSAPDQPAAGEAQAPAKAVKATQLERPIGPVMIGSVFLVVLMLNLVVLSFDFPRTTSVTLAAMLAAAFLGVLLLAKYYPNLIPFVSKALAKLQPEANAMFYFCYSIGMLLIYACVWINSKFDYWELRQNELLHHHGFMSDLERYSTTALKINKEIKDIFEYMLLKSGRMILQAGGGNQPPIILENVFFIDKKEKVITEMLSASLVQIAPSDELK